MAQFCYWTEGARRDQACMCLVLLKLIVLMRFRRSEPLIWSATWLIVFIHHRFAVMLDIWQIFIILLFFIPWL